MIEVPDAAAAQAGAFTTAQALEAGWSPRQLRTRVQRGSWVRIPGHSLAAADSPAGVLRDAWGVALAWPESVAVFRTAAAIWGLPVALDDRVHVWSRAGRHSRGVAVHRTPLGPNEVDLHDSGLLVCGQLRCIADCLALCSMDEALDLYAWLTSRNRLSRSAFMQIVRARTGARGARQLLALARLTRNGAVSAAEYRLQLLLRARGVNGWVCGARIYDDDGLVGVVDFLFRAQRLVIEMDGERAHKGRRAFVTDRRRQNRLVNAGYRVLRFTWWDITENPDAVIRSIEQALKSTVK